MKGVLTVIGYFLAFSAFIFALVGVPCFILIIPTELGTIGGVVLAIGLAFAVTYSKIAKSNDYGDSVGKYADYTDESMKFDRLL